MKAVFQVPNILDKVHFRNLKSYSGRVGYVYFLGSSSKADFEKIIREHALDYQKKDLIGAQNDNLHFVGKKGWVWIQKRSQQRRYSHEGLFNEAQYTQTRDGMGALVPVFRSLKLDNLVIFGSHLEADETLGALVGLSLGAYSFKSCFESVNPFEGLPQIYFAGEWSASLYKQALVTSQSVNLARHLANLPANKLNPKSYADFIKGLFAKTKHVKVSVWDENRLKKENASLLVAVGQGALFPPCLVHIEYRPKDAKKKKPIAFVGKGITFDSGGLDIKPSSAMRWMKKDMAGSASVVGLAYYVANSQHAEACDFYLALAENSVDSRSFRPGDVIRSRNGISVEIHNTDAEGRLVLADALDIAIKHKEKPRCVINLATLTGACRVALGTDLAGLFSNDDDLAEELIEAGRRRGDLCWRLPLVPRYLAQLSSSFAQMANASEGHGGAITAALFLEKFVGDVPWAHIDMYGWVDKSAGALTSQGGNGQAVQMLIEYLNQIKSN